jgi:pilus assembly protein CpaC
MTARFQPYLCAAALCALLAAAAAAQPAAPADLELLLGRGELLEFSTEIQRVAIAEPKVADAIVVSPREVMITAKGLGYTTVIIWETNAAPQRYNIKVVPDTTSFRSIEGKVRESVPGGKIELAGNEETLVLTGEVGSLEESNRAAALAGTHARKVVNLLRTPAPAEPRQIMLQVKFASVDRIALKEMGFNFFSRNATTLGGLQTQQYPGARFSQLQFQDQEFANATVNFSDLLNLFLFRPDLNIGATIRALQSRNLLQILAEPNLIAVEGKDASFLAGGQFPFPVITNTPTGGAVAPVITVQFKDFGVGLNFTPTVTPQGAIHLKVNPSVSALDFSNAVTIQGTLIPAVSTRTATTEVVLKDGESFAIAGLIDSRVVQQLSRVRGLGDVPILGYFFRSSSTKKTQDELMVVITPRFVKPLSAEERAKLPTTIEDFLPPADTELSKKTKGKKGGPRQPEYSGPTGHVEPAPAAPVKEKRN